MHGWFVLLVPCGARPEGACGARGKTAEGAARSGLGAVRRVTIAVMDGSRPIVMYNPQIISSNGEYTTVESCLSLTGERSATRFRSIEVSYLDEGFRPRTKHFCGFTAQIIQHEIDHCNGIVI